jgi:hypothetical protein
MCLKNDADPALGECCDAIREALKKEVPWFVAIERRRERERLSEEAERLSEEAAEQWADAQVRGTHVALLMRTYCESFGAVLWRAGVDVSPQIAENEPIAFEGFLANSTAHARVEELDGENTPGEDDPSTELAVDLYDDVVGYIDDYQGPRMHRRAAHGAPRRFCTEKAWVHGQKIRAKAPVRARQQKHEEVLEARQKIAEIRRVRRLRYVHLREME